MKTRKFVSEFFCPLLKIMAVYDLLLDCAITIATTVGFLFNAYICISLLVSKQVNISRVFLLSQLWIVNYYVKSSSNNLSNENIKTGVSREMIFQK